MRIREQLRPYIMRLYTAAAETGAPIMRPLFYDFWQDPVAQDCDDQLMFGPDYLVAPQLIENATSRSVYLPQLPAPFVWQDYFTGAEHNTTAGGVNITVDTPLDTFPLFFRLETTPYPLPPPPPKCDSSCTMTPHTDSATGGNIAHSNCTSFAACCALCKANSKCGAFVFGPYATSQPASPGNPLTCFQLGPPHGGTKRVAGRSYGCVRGGQ